MGKQGIGFHKDEKESYDPLVKGNYVIMFTSDGNTPAGRVSDIDNENVYLFPYQQARYTSEGQSYIEFSDKGSPRSIDRRTIVNVIETTKEDIEGNTRLKNMGLLKEFLELQKSLRELSQSHPRVIVSDSEETYEDGAGI